jgi:hypothetical protein
VGESEDERRRGERVPINDEFSSLDGPDHAGGTWVSDLSLGGVFVHTDELIPVGSMVDLRFTILVDDPIVIEAFGKVVRHSHKPRGIGVEFAAMSPETQLRIEDILARRRPLDSGAPLRLPEPNASPIGLPEDDDEDDVGDDDPTTTMTFARPAPVEGLGLRRVHKQEFEDAVTAAFPKVEGPAKPNAPAPSDSQRMRFKAPPLPKQIKRDAPARAQRARVHETNEDDRTQVYRAIPVEPSDPESDSD